MRFFLIILTTICNILPNIMHTYNSKSNCDNGQPLITVLNSCHLTHHDHMCVSETIYKQEYFVTTNRLNILPRLSYNDSTCLCRQVAITPRSDATTASVWKVRGDATGTNTVGMDRMRGDVVSNHPLTGFAKLKQFQKKR